MDDGGGGMSWSGVVGVREASTKMQPGSHCNGWPQRPSSPADPETIPPPLSLSR